MEWIERLNHAINYIEEQLTTELDYEKLGRIACCSSYHFQRMFTYMAGIPLSEYVRRRKMSLAAVDLQTGNERIIDVAKKYGYNSPTAFNRAFQSVHGVAPSAVKHEGVSVKSFPPLVFALTLKGMEEMNFKIEKKEAFRILGVSCPLSKVLEENFTAIPHEWDNALEKGILSELYALNNSRPVGLLGVSVHNSKEWKYFIAVSSGLNSSRFEEYYIPAATWAIFSGRGTNISLQHLERRVITEWLPTSGYEYAEIPDIEVYIKADPNDAIYEYWLPVVKRKEA